MQLLTAWVWRCVTVCDSGTIDRVTSTSQALNHGFFDSLLYSVGQSDNPIPCRLQYRLPLRVAHLLVTCFIPECIVL
jgi:hypothetical protein